MMEGEIRSVRKSDGRGLEERGAVKSVGQFSGAAGGISSGLGHISWQQHIQGWVRGVAWVYIT